PKVARGDGCWEWQGWRNAGGYGVLASGPAGRQKDELAHRIAWRLTNGAIPDGLRVLHRCDNPPCCNPAHLFLGSDADNVADCIAKGRSRRARRLTDVQVREIRASRDTIRAAGARFGISSGIISK